MTERWREIAPNVLACVLFAVILGGVNVYRDVSLVADRQARIEARIDALPPQAWDSARLGRMEDKLDQLQVLVAQLSAKLQNGKPPR